MKRSLKILLLECNSNDAARLIKKLNIEYPAHHLNHAECADSFQTFLSSGYFDLILAGYSVPNMDGSKALKLAKQYLPEVPFIFVSSQTSERLAVRMLNQGAADFVQKQRLIWLGASIRRALQLTQERKDRKKAQLELSESYRLLKESQWQLVHAEKMAAIGDLAAGIGHEINNPLAIIRTSTELLHSLLTPREDRPPPSQERIEKHLDKIESNVDRCKNIVRGLLYFAKDQGNEEAAPIDVRRLMKDTLYLIRSSNKVTGQRFAWNKEPLPSFDEFIRAPESFACDDGEVIKEPLWATTFPSQFQKVLLNLLLNASEATEKKGIIGVSIGPLRNGIQAIIADSGKGIKTAIRRRIFDPFFSTKPVGRGTGLGLYITHQLLQSLQGSIEIESREGQGTLARVWIPLVAPSRATQPSTMRMEHQS